MSVFLCLDVERPPSGPNEAESHEKLAQRIEKDVVSGFVLFVFWSLHEVSFIVS